MYLESDNNLWGRSKNPHDPIRTCGGSSGGEGGLLASNCIPFSIGTDIGGSIRCPSSFNGIYGIKPSPRRISYKGMTLPHKCA